MDNPDLLISFVIAMAIVVIMAYRMFKIFREVGAIEYIKNDWHDVLPYRLRCNKYKGASRPAYALLCVLYYSIKSALLFFFYFAISFLKYVPLIFYYEIKYGLIIICIVYYYLLFLWIWKGLSFLYSKLFSGENRVDAAGRKIKLFLSHINSKAEAARLWYQRLWVRGLWWNYEEEWDDEDWNEDYPDGYSIGASSIHEMTSLSINGMSGTDFEYFCADLLRANGFTDVCITPGAGDYGLDILAKKDGIKWGFQCKCWGENTHIGNDVILKTAGAREYYSCDIVAILTTTTFTTQAKAAAEQTRVLMWGPDKLNQLIAEKKNREQIEP